AGTLAAHALVAFLSVDRRAHAATAYRRNTLRACILHRPLVLERGALALRAPPPIQLLQLQQLFT
ncbi:MAG TPA: hypothetical protein VK760_05535, partial [Candidatus Acidoferrales bacterium]|nr:hypothetical protein [Candidatus Acidoferrales bacterium]